MLDAEWQSEHRFHATPLSLWLSPLAQVKATGSASFQLTWQTSPCRPQLLWEVLVAHHNATGAPQWTTLAKGIGGGSYEVGALRCPTGCSFKLRALDLTGWDMYSEPSPEVRSTTLRAQPEGAVRIEVAMATTPEEGERGGGAEAFAHKHVARLASDSILALSYLVLRLA